MRRSLPEAGRIAAPVLLAMALAFSCRAGRDAAAMGPLLAGRWYPAHAAELASAVDGMMAPGKAERIDGAAVIVVPHAGYMYSGKVAGSGYASVRGMNPGVVVVLAPSHRARFGGCAVLALDRYDTPLGGVKLDRKSAEKLAAHPLFAASSEAFAHEHAFEIQLPFLQRLFGAKLGADIAVLPVLVGEISDADAARAALKIVETIGDMPRPLFVVSSDFTHYGQRFGYVPFSERRTAALRERLRALDGGAIDLIVAGDARGFSRYVEKTGATICGRNPIMIALSIPLTDRAAAALAYDTSCSVTGECESSVSYAAIRILGRIAGEAQSGRPRAFGERERRFLLGLARGNIRSHLMSGRQCPVSPAGVPEACRARSGVFVTLKRNGRLRGCIGTIAGERPLFESVLENSYLAAFRDPRFGPLTSGELDGLSVEISVLTEPRAVSSVDEIVLGRDGIIVELGNRRALFLPQVATEQNWTREEFLTQACRKAGLPDDAWRSGAVIYTFRAEVFGDA